MCSATVAQNHEVAAQQHWPRGDVGIKDLDVFAALRTAFMVHGHNRRYRKGKTGARCRCVGRTQRRLQGLKTELGARHGSQHTSSAHLARLTQADCAVCEAARLPKLRIALISVGVI